LGECYGVDDILDTTTSENHRLAHSECMNAAMSEMMRPMTCKLYIAESFFCFLRTKSFADLNLDDVILRDDGAVEIDLRRDESHQKT